MSKSMVLFNQNNNKDSNENVIFNGANLTTREISLHHFRIFLKTLKQLRSSCYTARSQHENKRISEDIPASYINTSLPYCTKASEKNNQSHLTMEHDYVKNQWSINDAINLENINIFYKGVLTFIENRQKHLLSSQLKEDLTSSNFKSLLKPAINVVQDPNDNLKRYFIKTNNISDKIKCISQSVQTKFYTKSKGVNISQVNSIYDSLDTLTDFILSNVTKDMFKLSNNDIFGTGMKVLEKNNVLVKIQGDCYLNTEIYKILTSSLTSSSNHDDENLECLNDRRSIKSKSHSNKKLDNNITTPSTNITHSDLNMRPRKATIVKLSSSQNASFLRDSLPLKYHDSSTISNTSCDESLFDTLSMIHILEFANHKYRNTCVETCGVVSNQISILEFRPIIHNDIYPYKYLTFVDIKQPTTCSNDISMDNTLKKESLTTVNNTDVKRFPINCNQSQNVVEHLLDSENVSKRIKNTYYHSVLLKNAIYKKENTSNYYMNDCENKDSDLSINSHTEIYFATLSVENDYVKFLNFNCVKSHITVKETSISLLNNQRWSQGKNSTICDIYQYKGTRDQNVGPSIQTRYKEKKPFITNYGIKKLYEILFGSWMFI